MVDSSDVVSSDRRHGLASPLEREPLLPQVPRPLRPRGKKNDAPPVFLEFRSSKIFITFVVSFAVFVDSAIFAIIVPITPFYLPEVIGVPKEDVQYWTSVLLAVYSIGCFAVSPAWGWYTDRSPSRKGPLLLGILMLLAATATLWLGSTLFLQVLGRLFQGAAAAMVWITGLALIVDTVGSSEAGHYMSYVALAMMVGTLLAPMVGGVVYAKLGFDAVFGIVLSMIVGDLFLRYAAIDRNTASKIVRKNAAEEVGASLRRSSTTDKRLRNARPDAPTERCASATGGRAAHAPPPSPLPPAPPRLAAAPKRLRRTRLPAIVTLLRSDRLLAALWGTLVALGLFSGLEATLPLHTAATFGWRSVGGGLVFLPLTLPSFCGPAVGWLSDRYSARWPTAGGFALLCPALALLRFVARDTFGHKALLCVLLTVAGAGYTLTINPLTAEIAYVVESQNAGDGPGSGVPDISDGGGGGSCDDGCGADEGDSGGSQSTTVTKQGGDETVYAQAYALFNMAASVGGVLGPLCAGFVRDAAGWSTMTCVLAVFSATGVLVASLWTGGWIGRKADRRRQCSMDDEERSIP